MSTETSITILQNYWLIGLTAVIITQNIIIIILSYYTYKVNVKLEEHEQDKKINAKNPLETYDDSGKRRRGINRSNVTEL